MVPFQIIHCAPLFFIELKRTPRSVFFVPALLLLFALTGPMKLFDSS